MVAADGLLLFHYRLQQTETYFAMGVTAAGIVAQYHGHGFEQIFLSLGLVHPGFGALFLLLLFAVEQRPEFLVELGELLYVVRVK